MKSLVVFYSRTGITQKVAEAISEILECDIEEIRDTKNRKGALGYLASFKDAVSKKLTTIEEIKKNPASYDIIIIGTPVWTSTMSTPIRAYISQNKQHFQEVAFFCTQHVSGSENTFRNMEGLCEKKPLALLEIKTKEVKKNKYIQKVKEFTDKISEEK